MGSIWSDRRFVTFSAVALFGLAIHPAVAQRGSTPATPPSSAPGASPTSGLPTGRTPTSSIPTTSPYPGTYSTTPSPELRDYFFSGKVMFDDGTEPNPDIRIERVCGSTPRLEAHTDSKGRFSFQLGHEMSVDTDAADPSAGAYSGAYPGNGNFNSQMGGMGNASNPSDPLWNCELRASYPGYRSDVVELSSRRPLDSPDLGTIVLHRLTSVAGTTISLTTALAPKHAQKDYEKGLQLAAKGDFEEAEKHFIKATDAYPKYAIAWFALGDIQQKTGNAEGARKSYAAAIAADSKYVSPYNQLGVLAAQDAKWQDAADYSKQVIQLNPVEFPGAFWLNALANYKLKRLDEAEKSVRELLKADTAHKFPQAEGLLGEIFWERGNYPEAATHLRAYLTLHPDAKDADNIRQALAKIDQASAEAKK